MPPDFTILQMLCPKGERRLLAILAACLFLFAPAVTFADGTVAAWGSNNHGQLGDSTTTDRWSPVQSGNFSGTTVTQISAGWYHTCALTSNNTVYCWGNDGSNQLNVANPSVLPDISWPTALFLGGQPLENKTVTQISAGAFHTCAVTSDGAAYCWGLGSSGQLGNANSQYNQNIDAPVDASGPLAGKSIVKISAGDYHSCAVTSDGGAYCWGDNYYGELGNNATASTPQNPTPVAVDKSGALAGKLVTQISAGAYFTCAVTSDGGAYCWGSNGCGQLGDGSTTNRAAPVAVDRSGVLMGKTVTRISAGACHSCATTSDGGAYCWGNDLSGQLGDNATGYRFSPVAVDKSGALAGKAIIDVSAGVSNTCAISSDGGAFCWGDNTGGQLGTGGTGGYSSTPLRVATSGALAGAFFSSLSSGRTDGMSPGHTVAVGPACGPGADLTSGAGAQWHAFALPQMPIASPATIVNVFGTGTASNLDSSKYGVANPTAGTGWVIYRRNPATGANVQLAATDVLVPGEGYWIKSFQKTRTGKLFVDCQNAPPPATVAQAQGCASANGCVAVSVTTAQGASRVLLGQPFPWNTDWSKIRVRVNGSPATYTPSQAAGLTGSGDASPPVLGNTFWVWNGTSYDSFSDSGPTQGSLKLQKSFWVDVLAGATGKTVELLIPKDPSALMQ